MVLPMEKVFTLAVTKEKKEITNTFIKVILLMAFNKVKEFLNAKMEDGPTKESGNKEK